MRALGTYLERWDLSMSARIAACLFCCALEAVGAGALVLRVPGQHPTIQAAVDAAATGDTVLVAAGTYRENVLIEDKSLALIGAEGAWPTLDGEGLDSSLLRFERVAEPALVRGFRLIHGAGYLFNPSYSQRGGGGAYLDSSSVVFEQCGIEDSKVGWESADWGGGIYATRSTIVVRDLRCKNNTAGTAGGGISASLSDVSLERCEFSDNRTNRGGGTNPPRGGAVRAYDCTVTIDACTFERNIADDDRYLWHFAKGGAIYSDDGTLIVRDSYFAENVGTSGGAIYVWQSGGEVSYCVFVGNKAWGWVDSEYHIPYPPEGGAIHWLGGADPVSIYSNTFFANHAWLWQWDWPGKGAAVTAGAPAWIYNNIVVANTGSPAFSMMSPYMRFGYNLFHDNISDFSDYGEPKPVDVFADPEFVSGEEWDLRLVVSSPAVDRGHPETFDPDESVADLGARPVDQRFPTHAYLARRNGGIMPGRTEPFLLVVDNGTEGPRVETLRITARHAQGERHLSQPLPMGANQVRRLQLNIPVPLQLLPGPVEIEVRLDSGWVEIWSGRVVPAVNVTADDAAPENG